MTTRRDFMTSAAAFAALTGCRGPQAVGANPKADFPWAFLLHFGCNISGDISVPPKRGSRMSSLLTDAEFAALSDEDCWMKDRLRFNYGMWRELSAKLRADGCNMIVVDVLEGVVYPSHPELAVRGSWAPEKLADEVARLRGLGFEVVPKLNFSTCHHAWMGPYRRMVSTTKYYEVCKDLIGDVFDIFGDVRLFHLGMDEEDLAPCHHNTSMIIMRQGDLWAHDLRFLVNEVERRGTRAWVWNDLARRLPMEKHLALMPKSVLQSPWEYSTNKAGVDNACIRAFKTLADAGYDTVPCGSNCYGFCENFQSIAEFGKREMDPAHLKGFLMAPWLRILEPYRRLLWQSSDFVADARRRFANA